jgi:threonine/homoserine/homoserine lactone efflux protein
MGLMALMVAIIGGLPTAGGVVLVWVGWRIVHPKTPPRPDVTKTFE